MKENNFYHISNTLIMKYMISKKLLMVSMISLLILARNWRKNIVSPENKDVLQYMDGRNVNSMHDVFA